MNVHNDIQAIDCYEDPAYKAALKFAYQACDRELSILTIAGPEYAGDVGQSMYPALCAE